MLKEAKKWVQELEKTLTELSEEYGKSIEELDAEFEDFYDNGGDEYDCGSGGPYTNSIEAFRADYENRDDDDECEELEPEETDWEAKERKYANSRLIIQPIEGVDKPFFYIKQDPEGHTAECFNADKEGIERLKQVVHEREIDWINGYSALTTEDLTVAEFNRYVSRYLNY